MRCELDVVHGRPCELPGCAESTNPSLSCVPPLSRNRRRRERAVRWFGLDVHRDFCEVAIGEEGQVRSAGRIATRVEVIELFAQSLGPDDAVALEATSGSDKLVSVLQRHGVRVVVANTRKLKSITEARAKTDRLDARTLARLLMSGLLDEVWTPDERTRALRRLTSRRERVVRARTRAKNEAHGVLGRKLCERPPVTDCFGKAGPTLAGRA
jgi:transposase